MLAVLRSEQIRRLDQLTMKVQKLKSIELMERACVQLADAILNKYLFEKCEILCGPGNNGGDGLGVARLFHHQQKKVTVFISPENSKYSDDFKRNLESIQKLNIAIKYWDDFESDSQAGLIIDALLGTGLDRPIQGKLSALVEKINQSNSKVISIDMPTGMPDIPLFELANNTCIRAETVFTIGYPKLSLLLAYSSEFCQRFIIVDIQLEPFVGETEHYLIEEKDVSTLLKPNNTFAHKYSRGSALMLGGSSGMSGSIVMSCEAALRSGTGLVTAYIPRCIEQALQNRLPEAMYILNGADHLESFKLSTSKFNAIGVGPGMQVSRKSSQILEQLFKNGLPVVIDADALRCIGEYNLHAMIPENSILSPHEGEFKALVGNWQTEQDKLDKLLAYAGQIKSIVILKGAYTIVCDGIRCYFNSTGHPAMATAGSGDVLLGLLTGLRAQSYPPLDAALLGVFIHGAAANHYLKLNASDSLIATDITKSIGPVLKELRLK